MAYGLTKKQNEALELNNKGMTQQQIADTLNISIGAVSNRLFGCKIKGYYVNYHWDKKKRIDLDKCKCHTCKNFEENIENMLKKV